MLNSILLIDDNTASNFIHETYLNRVGCAKKVFSFTMAKKALDYLATLETFPELIFIDINMPTMDAWEFMDVYKDFETSRKINTRVILLTTSIMPSDEGKMEKYKDIETMMFKPLNQDTIKEVLTKYFDLTF